MAWDRWHADISANDHVPVIDRVLLGRVLPSRSRSAPRPNLLKPGSGAKRFHVYSSPAIDMLDPTDDAIV